MPAESIRGHHPTAAPSMEWAIGSTATAAAPEKPKEADKKEAVTAKPEIDLAAQISTNEQAREVTLSMLRALTQTLSCLPKGSAVQALERIATSLAETTGKLAEIADKNLHAAKILMAGTLVPAMQKVSPIFLFNDANTWHKIASFLSPVDQCAIAILSKKINLPKAQVIAIRKDRTNDILDAYLATKPETLNPHSQFLIDAAVKIKEATEKSAKEAAAEKLRTWDNYTAGEKVFLLRAYMLCDYLGPSKWKEHKGIKDACTIQKFLANAARIIQLRNEPSLTNEKTYQAAKAILSAFAGLILLKNTTAKTHFFGDTILLCPSLKWVDVTVSPTQSMISFKSAIADAMLTINHDLTKLDLTTCESSHLNFEDTCTRLPAIETLKTAGLAIYIRNHALHAEVALLKVKYPNLGGRCLVDNKLF